MTPRTVVHVTERLRLTTWLAADLPDLSALHADPEVMRHMASGPQDEQRTRERLETWQREHAARGWSKWRVEDHDGAMIGRAGFGRAHDTGHRELGFLLAAAAWGQGYASELATALTGWHRCNPDPSVQPALRAYVFAGNHASRRVLTKAGFQHLGTAHGDPRQLLFELPPE